MSMEKTQVLYIEDNPMEKTIIKKFLEMVPKQSFVFSHESTLKEGINFIKLKEVTVLLLDLGLPDSTGEKTFTTVHELFPALPIVVLTGTEQEDLGIDLIKAGAQDYLIKGQINSALLSRTLLYAIERKTLANELENALADIKTLSGLVPICANCKKIRDDLGYWTQLERFIEDHSYARFSHGICPECAQKLYGSFLNEEDQDK